MCAAGGLLGCGQKRVDDGASGHVRDVAKPCGVWAMWWMCAGAPVQVEFLTGIMLAVDPLRLETALSTPRIQGNATCLGSPPYLHCEVVFNLQIGPPGNLGTGRRWALRRVGRAALSWLGRRRAPSRRSIDRWPRLVGVFSQLELICAVGGRSGGSRLVSSN